MDCHVHPVIKKQRMHELISLGKAKLHCFMDEQVDSINEVLLNEKISKDYGLEIQQTS